MLADAGPCPVVLVHGWGGSFATTWQHSGFTDLLADAGREVVGVDLLGHGTAPKPHDPDEYADKLPAEDVIMHFTVQNLADMVARRAAAKEAA